jgi:GT2 family glycosyltransferase
MADKGALKFNVPSFDEQRYLQENPDARKAFEEGKIESGFEHYLSVGIDENRAPKLKRASTSIKGAVERALVSESGYFLIIGWLDDEGREASKFWLLGGDFNVEIPNQTVLRYARRDVETAIREGAFDFGYLTFGRCRSRHLLQQPFLVQAISSTGSFQARVEPEAVSDKRLLDMLLILAATSPSHAGKEGNLHAFLASAAGGSVVDLFRTHVAANTAAHYVETFRPRPVSRTFISVLFGSTEAVRLQPVLFRDQNIDFGEWIYVCNSPEDATSVLRLGRLISELYDVMITVIIMTDNVGFGAANNVAVSHASSDSIYVINPDVFPLAQHAGVLRDTLATRDLGSTLWGGLLFYDDHNLMHSGMYIEQDSFFRCPSMNKSSVASAKSFDLARVEHFDKGVPFEEGRWARPMAVPAITGALMAFRRPYFEKIDGFSTRYIYGHYEDADLSLRWAQENGPVAIDPGLRLVHLEGQGSRSRGEQYRSAAMINRYFFSLRHHDFLKRGAASSSQIRELAIATA